MRVSFRIHGNVKIPRDGVAIAEADSPCLGWSDVKVRVRVDPFGANTYEPGHGLPDCQERLGRALREMPSREADPQEDVRLVGHVVDNLADVGFHLHWRIW
jgi:hypothetical protein